MNAFSANSMAVLIGSLPMDRHDEATQLVLKYTPDVPLWVQLPKYPEEGMIPQFLPGFPGVTREGGKIFIDSNATGFEDELVSFYEEYIAVSEGAAALKDSRFRLTEETARGFFTLLDTVGGLTAPPAALKGQVTGPVTMGIGVKDREGRVVFFDDRLKDVIIKHIAMKARWQAEQLASKGAQAIVFFDEPGLASFGTSAFISISKEQINEALTEAVDGVHAADGLAGVHICANADWSLALESNVDIISFDAYSFFDKFILYPDLIKAFIHKGGILAWGIIPTSDPQDIERETSETLFAQWREQAEKIIGLGIDGNRLLKQVFITPSCGTGSLSLDHATKVLDMTRSVSEKVRALM
jgi:methionine synthase II (cobalamin-independent)